MKAEDFRDFLALMKWTDAEAMRQLGIGSHNTLAKYKEDGGPIMLGMACAAFAARLPSWRTDLVPVYSFQVWNQALGENVIPKHKRTTHGIMLVGGVLIEGTQQMVRPDQVDGEGRYVAAAS